MEQKMFDRINVVYYSTRCILNFGNKTVRKVLENVFSIPRHFNCNISNRFVVT